MVWTISCLAPNLDAYTVLYLGLINNNCSNNESRSVAHACGSIEMSRNIVKEKQQWEKGMGFFYIPEPFPHPN